MAEHDLEPRPPDPAFSRRNVLTAAVGVSAALAVAGVAASPASAADDGHGDVPRGVGRPRGGAPA
jgi:hypothetical protein